MNETTYLYRLWDSRGALLYVGVSNNWMRRLDQHAKGKDWSPQVVRVTTQAFDSREAALQAESSAIQLEGPIHNIAGVQRFPAPVIPKATEWDHIAVLWTLLSGVLGVTMELVQELPSTEAITSATARLYSSKALMERLA